jgi:hypothetical protein
MDERVVVFGAMYGHGRLLVLLDVLSHNFRYLGPQKSW